MEKIKSKIDFMNKILIDESIVIIERTFDPKNFQPLIRVETNAGKRYEYTMELASDTLEWIKNKIVNQEVRKQ